MEEKPKKKKFLVLGLFLIIFVFAGAVFGAYKLSQKQVEPTNEKVACKDPRPEVCTMECIQNPPYICGSDGKSYCTECQACANREVNWYMTQEAPCAG